MNNVINMTRFLTNFSKTLGIAKEIIPIINDYKPLLNNFKNIYGIITKTNDNDNDKNIKSEPIKEVKKESSKEEKRTIEYSNSPQFFI